MTGRDNTTKTTYLISSVAERYQIHPQTLRMYEREGLLRPSRSRGNTRLYTDEDLGELEVILHLTRDLGINLAGVEVVLNMRGQILSLQRDLRRLLELLPEHLDARSGRGEALVPISRPTPAGGARPRPPSGESSKLIDGTDT